MSKAFNSSTATVPAATAISVAELLAAEGYTGSMVGIFLQIDKQALATLFMGHDSTVDAATGRAVTVFTRTSPPAVDPSRIWLFSTAGGEIGLTFEAGWQA